MRERGWLPPKKRAKSRSPCGDVGEEDLKDRGSSRIDALSSWHCQCSAAGGDSKCKEASEHMMAMKVESQSISRDKAGSRHFSRQTSFCGNRGKQCMTKAEKEAKRLRRVLANRESARQTILRRQERELVMKEYLSLRDMNMQLKEQMAKTIKFEIKEDPSVLVSRKSELPTSSTTNPSMMVDGSVKSCSSVEDVIGSSLLSGRTEDAFQSIVTEKSKDATENVRILMPTQAGIPTLKALQIAKVSIHLPNVKTETSDHYTGNVPGNLLSSFHPKNLVDASAAAEARKRRKELTKLKHLLCTQGDRSQ